MATDTFAPGHPPAPPTSQPPRKPDSETDEERVYRNVSFASTDYIPWILGRLRLGRADLTRMNSSGVPVLRSHDGDSPVGRVTSVLKDEMAGLWKSDWVLPKISSNTRSFEQLDSGLLRGVSVGGHLDIDSIVIDNEGAVDNVADLLLTADWMLVEQSRTPIPADVRAGIDRSAGAYVIRGQPLFDLLISPDGISSPDTPELRARIGNLIRTHNSTITTLRRETQMTTQTQIPPDVLQRAVADEIARTETLKSLTEIPAKLDKLTADVTAENQRNMEYRSKLDKLQFQPGGAVLQMSNWKPGVDHVLDLGRVLRLEQQGDLGFPKGEPDSWTLERSFQEQMELEAPGRNTAARLPWKALEEREKQLSVQRATMASGAGARPTSVTVLGNGGLVFAGFAPILSRMVVQMGVRGAQKLPWATTQPTAAAGAEGAAITVSNLVLSNAEFLPKSIASAYELTSSLEASDDGTFESLIMLAVRSVVSEQLVSQILVGGGTDEIAGIWGTTGVPNVNYGAQGEFDRQDALDVLDSVRLADSDGGMPVMVASKGLWQLMQKTPRATETYGPGTTSGGGVTEISRFVLDDMMYTEDGVMGMVEGAECHYFSDLKPTSVNDAGLVFKANRCIVWLFGNSLTLIEVPSEARKTTYKLTAEANFAIAQPSKNASRVKRT